MVLLALIAFAMVVAVACGSSSDDEDSVSATNTPAATAVSSGSSGAVPTAKPTDTKVAAAAVQAKVTRLDIAISPPIIELVLGWMGTNLDANMQVRHFAEPLVETNWKTGVLEPGLATEWQMDKADGTQWTFKLRKDIPFRSSVKDWGVFKAKDVVHSIAMIVQPDAIATDTGLFRGLYGKTGEDVAANIDIVDDNTVVFNLMRPEATLAFVNSAQQGNLFMYSKDQFDAEGVDGYEQAAAGTGPWVFTERKLGTSIAYRRVEDHYRKTAEFEEFRLLRVPEAATRLAQLLAGEVQIAEIDRDLHSQATSRGKLVVNSQLPAIQLTYGMGGVFQPYMETYDPTVPALDIRVREAMVRSVNAQEIRDTLLGGQGTPLLHVYSFHPSLDGWNPRWEEEFDEKYGYDPERARELLKEAGYPDGFDLKVIITSLPGAPEMITMAEAVVGYFQKVGINAVGEEVEWAKFRSDYYVPAKTHNTVAPFRGALRPPMVTLRFYHISGPEGFFRIIVDPAQDDKYRQVEKSVDLAERDRLQREIGDILFDGYATIPIAWLPGQLMIDPDIIAEFIYPGNVSSILSHIEYVKPVAK